MTSRSLGRRDKGRRDKGRRDKGRRDKGSLTGVISDLCDFINNRPYITSSEQTVNFGFFQR